MRKQSMVNACCQLRSLFLVVNPSSRQLSSLIEGQHRQQSSLTIKHHLCNACKVHPQVLDDNCTLCLPNGERLKLNPVSPATVSRCGMVYVPPDHLGWRYSLAAHTHAFTDGTTPCASWHVGKHSACVNFKLLCSGRSKHLCDNKGVSMSRTCWFWCACLHLH